MKKSKFNYKKLESPTTTELHQLAVALNSDNPEKADIKGTIEYFRDEISNLNKEEKVIFVSLFENVIIGFMRVDYSNVYYEWINHGIETAREHRQKGAATELLKIGCEFAKSKGAKSIIARTHKENKASLALHKNFGFVCETDDYIEDTGEKSDKSHWQLRFDFITK